MARATFPDSDTCVSCWGIVPPDGVSMVPDDGELCSCDDDNYGKLTDTRNHETHWFTCYVCGGVSWGSDTAALAGLESLTPANVMHDTNCPGRVFPDKHVRRIQRTY